jgi:hypothetical protein
MSSWTIKISKTIKCYLVGLQNLVLTVCCMGSDMFM